MILREALRRSKDNIAVRPFCIRTDDGCVAQPDKIIMSIGFLAYVWVCWADTHARIRDLCPEEVTMISRFDDWEPFCSQR